MDSVNDELQRRINEHVLNGDAPSIIWAMEGQIRINTKLEAKLAELERREALLTDYIIKADQAIAELPKFEATVRYFGLALLAQQARVKLDWIPQP
jgi:hypothetical protein